MNRFTTPVTVNGLWANDRIRTMRKDERNRLGSVSTTTKGFFNRKCASSSFRSTFQRIVLRRIQTNVKWTETYANIFTPVCARVCLASVPDPKRRSDRQGAKCTMYNMLSNFLADLIIHECDAYWLFGKWTREISRGQSPSRSTRLHLAISRLVRCVEMRETMAK